MPIKPQKWNQINDQPFKVPLNELYTFQRNKIQ